MLNPTTQNETHMDDVDNSAFILHSLMMCFAVCLSVATSFRKWSERMLNF